MSNSAYWLCEQIIFQACARTFTCFKILLEPERYQKRKDKPVPMKNLTIES